VGDLPGRRTPSTGVPPLFGQKPEYEFVKDLALALGHDVYPFNVTYEKFMDDALQAGLGFGLADS